MQQFILPILVGLALGASTAQPFKDTAVPNSQIQAVVRDVAEWHDMQHPDCKFVKPSSSKLVTKTSDSTIEHWSIEACSGKIFTYQVMVMPGPSGGVSDSVSNVDGSPASSTLPKAAAPTATECSAKKKELEKMGPIEKIPDSKVARAAELSAAIAACDAQ